MEKHFKAREAVEALGRNTCPRCTPSMNRLIRPTKEDEHNHCPTERQDPRSFVHGSRANNDAAVAAEAYVMKDASARTSFESSS